MTQDPTLAEYPELAHSSPFSDVEDAFRATVRAFIDKELEPHYDNLPYDWDSRHEIWRKAGKAGILGASIPEEYGGPGAGHIPNVIISHELARSEAYATLGSLFSTDMATGALIASGNDELIRTWAPKIMAGEAIQAMAITEADAGSDVLAMRTTAKRDGDHYVINGSKMFITNGDIADCLYVIARTSSERNGKALTMFLVDPSIEGVTRKKIKTAGFVAGNTAELTFDNVRVPVAQRMGEEGAAMKLMMDSIEYDRLQIAARALGQAELAYRHTLEFVKMRQVFGKTVWDYQNTQFQLATVKTDLSVGTAYLHDTIRKIRGGTNEPADGMMVKLWMTEMATRSIDACLQLFGGMGFMDETPISRIYSTNRVLRIYAGTSEILRRNIARTI